MGGRAYTGRTYVAERSSTDWTEGGMEVRSSGCVGWRWCVLGPEPDVEVEGEVEVGVEARREGVWRKGGS